MWITWLARDLVHLLPLQFQAAATQISRLVGFYRAGKSSSTLQDAAAMLRGDKSVG